MAPAQRQLALRLRELVLDTAAATPGVGRLTEALRWGQPSYLTAATGSGSTVRLDAVPGSATQVALYFHCQTGLIAEFRTRYAALFQFSGNRALVFHVDDAVPDAALRHCVSLALTYHSRKTTARKARSA